MLKMEEWIVLFVFAELVALGVLIIVSCWCCRRSLRRAREEEETHDLPVTRVVAGAAARPKTATAQSSSNPSRATNASGESAAGAHHTDSRESQDADLVSGGIWDFIAGVSPRGPRRPTRSPAPALTTTTTTTTTTSSNHSSHASRGGTVEVVNISVNAAVGDSDDDRDDKLASEGRKSGTAA